jgi:hypothetical protein
MNDIQLFHVLANMLQSYGQSHVKNQLEIYLVVRTKIYPPFLEKENPN